MCVSTGAWPIPLCCCCCCCVCGRAAFDCVSFGCCSPSCVAAAAGQPGRQPFDRSLQSSQCEGGSAPVAGADTHSSLPLLPLSLSTLPGSPVTAESISAHCLFFSFFLFFFANSKLQILNGIARQRLCLPRAALNHILVCSSARRCVRVSVHGSPRGRRRRGRKGPGEDESDGERRATNVPGSA